MLQGEAENISSGKRCTAFQGGKPAAVNPQLRLPVRPWSIDALGSQPLRFIEDVVQYLEAEMAHPDFINVRKGKYKADLRGVFYYASHFATHVSGGFLNVQQ